MIILEEKLTVLKYSSPEAPKASAISLVVTTQDMGWPLPIGFPIVTMSGTKSSPCSWNPQNFFPTRPKPTWTSSAMKTPPALRTALKIKREQMSHCDVSLSCRSVYMKTSIMVLQEAFTAENSEKCLSGHMLFIAWPEDGYKVDLSSLCPVTEGYV